MVLANLSTRYDVSGSNKPFFLRKIMASYYCKDFEKSIYTKFQFFIENDTLEYRNALSGQAVLTGHWVFKIKKNQIGQNLEIQSSMDSTQIERAKRVRL